MYRILYKEMYKGDNNVQKIVQNNYEKSKHQSIQTKHP